ncbi:lipocalin family protein [Tenacibaculum aiptasiae]|uniref:lipocalin family protein n=1 Tax=Tenacibaculum aiptasiae TaxID=426481 RepID=UPI003B5A150F
MKKILFLSIALFSLISCSSNDEDSLDPFIGTWYLFSINNQEVSDCLKNNTVNILENGNLTFTSYDLINNVCKVDDTGSSTWKNKGGGNYGITTKGTTIERINKVLFSNNNNTFTYTETNNSTAETSTYKRK